jgi:pimeloyl-ACP methyl ester carboxylesterase
MINGKPYRYINHNQSQTFLLIHGLGCSGIYFDEITAILGNLYNYLIYDLPGHGNNSETNFTLKSVVNCILLAAEKENTSIDCIMAHSMGSIIAFEIDAIIKSRKIFLLSGNLIPEDFSLSTEIQKMDPVDFAEYWHKFKKTYRTFLKFEVKSKKINYDPYSDDIQKTRTRQIYRWGKIIAGKKLDMLYYKNSFPNTILIEGRNYKFLASKRKFCEKNDIAFLTIENACHFIHIERPEEISQLVLKSLNNQ